MIKCRLGIAYFDGGISLDNLHIHEIPYLAKTEKEGIVKGYGLMTGIIDERNRNKDISNSDYQEIIDYNFLTKSDLENFEALKDKLDQELINMDNESVICKLKVGDKTYIDNDIESLYNIYVEILGDDSNFDDCD